MQDEQLDDDYDEDDDISEEIGTKESLMQIENNERNTRNRG